VDAAEEAELEAAAAAELALLDAEAKALAPADVTDESSLRIELARLVGAAEVTSETMLERRLVPCATMELIAEPPIAEVATPRIEVNSLKICGSGVATTIAAKAAMAYWNFMLAVM